MATTTTRICCGGESTVRCDRRTVINNRSSCVVLPVVNRRKVSMSMSIEKTKKIDERKRGGSVVSREKLDEWLRDSVVEIVKNLRDSSLLVHLYAEANGGLVTTSTKDPEAEDWVEIEGRWGRGEERTPEGVIFVEKLVDDDDVDYEVGYGGEGTSAWGIVAQGRGGDSGPVCYLLKTTRVGSGMGTVCTHFRLVKVKSFRETAVSQLSNSWLVKNGQ